MKTNDPGPWSTTLICTTLVKKDMLIANPLAELDTFTKQYHAYFFSLSL